MEIAVKTYGSKKDMYAHMNAELVRMLAETDDRTANLANASALLALFLADINWAGFYLMKNGALVLGPFQGKPAVTRIEVGQGVCGTAAAERKTQRVDDVHTCTNHIACDLASSSEIVVPLIKDGQLLGVLDIDSPKEARFDPEDQAGLEAFAGMLAERAW